MPTRILVVDDSPTIRHVVSTLLERNGYEPKVASDGQDAYDALASGEVKVDLVLVDFVMPRMNGFQLCQAIRQNEELAGLPVILMSAKSDRIRAQFVEQTGAIDAITKPFDARALVAVVENALRRLGQERLSSERLPDLGPDDIASTGEHAAVVTSVAEGPHPAADHETKRTHIAQIVAQKLAGIAARALRERPFAASAEPILVEAIAERLSNEAILEMVESIGDLDRQDAGGALLSGDLGVIPIGAILQLLQAENQTGVLVCKRDRAEVRASFREGVIDLVQSSGAGDEFRLGRYFLEEGILRPEEIEAFTSGPPTVLARAPGGPPLDRPSEVSAPETQKGVPGSQFFSDITLDVTRDLASSVTASVTQELDALARTDEGVATVKAPDLESTIAALSGPVTVPAAPKPLGMALLAAGKIQEAQLRTALTRQSSELLYEVLRWSYGRFDLRREPASELARSARLGMPVASVVMEGFRRVDEWRVLERTLGSFDAVLLRDDAAFGRLDIGSLPPRERAVLEAADGLRSIRGIIVQSNVSSFDACRILAQFLEARVLRRRSS